MFTSAECLMLLQEKEEKKRRDKEEKEQRKLTRELNKKRREEEQRKKVEERAKKAAQRQAEKEKKETEKAIKQVEKIAKQVSKKSKEGSTSECRKRPATTSDPGQDRSIRQKFSKSSSPEHINPNQCCACFGLLEDDIGMGSEWLQCSCTRWIHEECVEDVVCSDNGEEKRYPLCLATVSAANYSRSSDICPEIIGMRRVSNACGRTKCPTDGRRVKK